MKKRINLFEKKSGSASTFLSPARIRLVGTGIGLVLFVAFIAVTVLQIQQQQQYNALIEQKKTLLEYQLENKTSQAKISYFLNKKGQFDKFVKDDAQFLPYYDLLKKMLEASNQQATLESMVIDKDKATEFVIRFETYPPVFDFIKYVESSNFLDRFTSLTLDSFALSQDTANTQKGYRISFKGKFKTIKDENPG